MLIKFYAEYCCCVTQMNESNEIYKVHEWLSDTRNFIVQVLSRIEKRYFEFYWAQEKLFFQYKIHCKLSRPTDWMEKLHAKDSCLLKMKWVFPRKTWNSFEVCQNRTGSCITWVLSYLPAMCTLLSLLSKCISLQITHK